MFITFYGVNNIGKTTQTKRLKERLINKGYKCGLVKYPVYDLEPTGPFISNQLRGPDGQTITEEELQMWYVLNRKGYEPTLRKMIAETDVLIAEDYVETGIAWGTAKGASESWLIELNRYLLKEDIKILLTGERIKTSVEAGHIHENDDDLTDICGEVLLRRSRAGGWLIIPVQTTIDATADLIWKAIEPRLP